MVPAMPAAVAALLAGSALPFQFPSEFQKPTDRVLYYREGLAGTTKVFEDRDNGAKRMSIDGIVIGGTEFTDYKQQVLAHLPKVILEEYRTELSIGLGSGILIGESLRHPGLQRLVCVEIEPSVVEGAAHFAAENHGVLEDPRARIVIDDIADFLRTHPERYDIISADEKTADRYASNGFSFSSDYYALLRSHLTDRGLVIQWLANQLPTSQYRMVLATFAASFPEVRLLYLPAVDKGGPVNTFLVGSLEPLSLDPAAMNERLRRETAAFDGWRRYGIDSAEAILAHYVADGPPVRAATVDAPRNSLEFPLYEFYSPREYAVPLNERVLRNHEFLVPLRAAHGAPTLSAADEGRLASAARGETEFLDGLALQLAGSPHEAIADRYGRAVAIAPWNRNLRSQVVSYLWNVAGVRYLAGDATGALPLLAEAARLVPDHGEVRYYHGLALLRAGSEGPGLEEMRAAVELRPRLLPPRRVLASALGRRGDLDAAAAQLEAILEIDPEDLFALVTYGNLLAEGWSRPAEARRYVERAARIAPADPAVIDLRAWVAYLEGHREAARRIVREGGSYYEGNPLYEGRRSRILE
jgi:spermidine synthase/Flp pilus assembly protein TadD